MKHKNIPGKLRIAAQQNTKERDYWLREFSGEFKRTGFPYDYPHKKTLLTEPLEVRSFVFSEEVSKLLCQRSGQQDEVLHLYLITGLTILLQKYTFEREEEITICTPIYKQDQEGEFVNTHLPLRIKLETQTTLKEWVIQVKEKLIHALTHQNFPILMLPELCHISSTESSGFPLFEVGLLMEGLHDRHYLDQDNMPLNMVFTFLREHHTIKCILEYNQNIYNPETVDHIFQHLQNLFQEGLPNLGKRISELSVVSEEEKGKILKQFNQSSENRYIFSTLPQIFQAKVALYRDQIALACGSVKSQELNIKETENRKNNRAAEQFVTFQELNTGANQLAARLRKSGILYEEIVGIKVQPSLDMQKGILGILKAGAGYLPIDPDCPQDREAYMLGDSGVRFLLTTKALIHTKKQAVSIMEIEEPESQNPLFGDLPGLNSPGDLMYVLYTSGSTGRPKGVMVEHQLVVNFLYGLHQTYPVEFGDAFLMKTAYVFDVSVTELFGWIWGGGKLVIMGNDERKDPRRMCEVIRDMKITHVNFVPSLLEPFIEIIDAEHGKLPSMKYIFSAGEEILPRVVTSYRESGIEAKLENLYGPTEATVYATGYSLAEWTGQGRIPIGNPRFQHKIKIMSQDGEEQGIGMPGELMIQGTGICRGYLNQPQLTKEKIRINSVYEKDYHSGDLAAWNPDGTLEFLGRIDNQVKIRGFRIELGEIESHLMKHENIKSVKVIAKSQKNIEETNLYAYILFKGEGGEKANEGELVDFLTPSLPEYMIPTCFISLKEFPLTPTGKIDLKALPEPETPTKKRYYPPTNQVEQKLLKIWQEVLHRAHSESPPGTAEQNKIGIDDRFLEIGGHSIGATRVAYQVYREFGVSLEIRDVFTYPTIREMGEVITRYHQKEISQYQEVHPVELKEYYDLSYAQKRLWVLCQFEEDSTAYNMPGALMLTGDLQITVFEQAVRELVKRHESLRTVFVNLRGEPRQKVNREFIYKIQNIKLQNQQKETREKKAKEMFTALANQALDLEQGPLFIVKLIQLEQNKWLLIYNIHHIVNDGWSQGILRNEVILLYNRLLGAKESGLAELKLQYCDYTHWHHTQVLGEESKKQGKYWLEKFKDTPNGIQLPYDHPRRPIQTFNGQRHLFKITRERLQPLHQISVAGEATLFMSLLSLVIVFLYKYTFQEDIIIGSPIAGRKHLEFQGMVGFLVNTLVYRLRINPEETFIQVMTRIREETLQTYENQDFPFDLLVEKLGLERDMSQSPLFNVMLAHNNAETEDDTLQLEGIGVSPYIHGSDFNMSKFDLIFFMNEVNQEVHVLLEYNSDLFEETTIQGMAENFLTLVDNVTRKPKIPIYHLQTLSPGESEKILFHFNHNDMSFPELFIQELCENQVEKIPNQHAVIDREETITYRELNRWANQLAHYIRNAFGVEPNKVIGISMERSIRMIGVMLGIIKSGAGYLAIDPTYPRDRILHILSNSKSDWVIMDLYREELFGGYKGSIIELSPEVGKLEETLKKESKKNPEIKNRGTDILYVNYTSGSTGTPNGAMLSHHLLSNLIQWQKENTTIDLTMRVLQFTSINFCVSFQEIMGTLTSGGELYLIGDVERQDIDFLMRFLSQNKIEILYLPFSYLNFLFNETQRWIHSFHHKLKHIITAGEQLKITSGIRKFLEQNPKIRLHNHYGSTEMHVVTSFTMDSETAEKELLPPAGKPINNVKIYILDEYLQPVPLGVWGEIFVKGPIEVLGYINNEELTQKKLVLHPQLSKDGIRLYRSGDIGRWRKEGDIELGGRKDFQVKIRGFRVEPGEIESKILSIEEIKECVVEVKDDPSKQKYLVAYIVTQGIDRFAIKRTLSQTLPAYMIPQLVLMESLPLMPNGKVDKQQLPEPGPEILDQYIPPANAMEKRLVEIWAEVLGVPVEEVSVTTSFFDMGGHSLKATLLMSGIQKEFNRKIPLVEIFKTPYIRDLSQYIQQADPEGVTTIDKAPQKDYYPLSSSQKRLYLLQQAIPESTRYNMPLILRIKGPLSKEKFEKAFQGILERHEIFRTSFQLTQGKPTQRIHPMQELEFSIQYHDIREPQNSVSPGTEQLVKSFIKSFDLSRVPLIRVELIKEMENQHILMYDMHHIITDGTSMEILIRDFFSIYSGKSLPELKRQYKDYAQYQFKLTESQSDNYKKQEHYWMDVFSGTIPKLNMPTDRPGNNNPLAKGSIVKREVSAELCSLIREVGKGINQPGMTLYMILLAAYNILLSKYTLQEDLVVGSPVTGRNFQELRDTIGLFVNMIAMRNQPKGNKSIEVFLKEVKENTLKAFENQDYPFERLVEKINPGKTQSQHPVFETVLALQNLYEGEIDPFILQDWKDIEIEPYPTGHNAIQHALLLNVQEKKNTLSLRLEYSTELYKDTTAERIMDHFVEILHQMCGETKKPIKDIHITHELAEMTNNLEEESGDFNF
jgi:amino acid adenylation domain-containing protein